MGKHKTFLYIFLNFLKLKIENIKTTYWNVIPNLSFEKVRLIQLSGSCIQLIWLLFITRQLFIDISVNCWQIRVEGKRKIGHIAQADKCYLI